jgi:hypothetical protein
MAASSDAVSSDDEVRAQLAGRVLLAMKRSSESIDLVLSARQRHLAVGDGGDDGDGDGEGDEGCNSGACGIDDGGSWRPPDHDVHSAAHAHSGPSDGDAEEASEDAALHSPWQGAGDGESFLDASIQLALEVEHDVDRPREEGVFGADTVRQVLEEALESAESATSSPRPARLSSAGSFTRAESASSADSQPLLQVGMGTVMVTKSQRVPEVPVMGSDCMRDELISDQENRWMQRGVRGKGFQNMLHKAPVPPLPIGFNLKPGAQDRTISTVSRVITFHDLFATLDASATSPQNSRPPASRPGTRGSLSRGNALSQTPTMRKRVITTPRAQTARDSHEKTYNNELFTSATKPMTARTREPLDGWDSWDMVDLDALHQADEVDPAVYTPTYIGLASRGSSRRNIASPRDGRAGGSPQSRVQSRFQSRALRLNDEVSLQLFGKGSHRRPPGDCNRGSQAARTSFIDAAAVGHGSSGLFSVIIPRRQHLLRSAPPPSGCVFMDRNTPQHDNMDGLQNMLFQRKLMCAPAITTRVRTSLYDELRRHRHKLLWTRHERQCRDLWSVPRNPRNKRLGESFSALSAIVRALIILFTMCQGAKTAAACHRGDRSIQPQSTAEIDYDSKILRNHHTGRQSDEFVLQVPSSPSVFLPCHFLPTKLRCPRVQIVTPVSRWRPPDRYMPRSELEDEGQQVQGFLNMLVETGALKMYDTRTGLHESNRHVDDDIRVEDGILSRCDTLLLG